MLLVASTLLDAIIPKPNLSTIASAKHRLTRNLAEPPRRRKYLTQKLVS
jgi:hypothetical protein